MTFPVKRPVPSCAKERWPVWSLDKLRKYFIHLNVTSLQSFRLSVTNSIWHSSGVVHVKLVKHFILNNCVISQPLCFLYSSVPSCTTSRLSISNLVIHYYYLIIKCFCKIQIQKSYGMISHLVWLMNNSSRQQNLKSSNKERIICYLIW